MNKYLWWKQMHPSIRWLKLAMTHVLNPPQGCFHICMFLVEVRCESYHRLQSGPREKNVVRRKELVSGKIHVKHGSSHLQYENTNMRRKWKCPNSYITITNNSSSSLCKLQGCVTRQKQHCGLHKKLVNAGYESELLEGTQSKLRFIHVNILIPEDNCFEIVVHQWGEMASENAGLFYITPIY